MSFDLNEYYEKLNDGEVILSFKGSVTSDLISNVLEVVENKMDDLSETSKIRKKVYNVLVESLQNLYHHVDDLPENLQKNLDPRFGIIIVKRLEEGKYRITTGNFVVKAKTKILKDKIDKINSLSKDELKDMYKFILNHQKLSAKGGGGLGLVDIARKTGNKLKYNFDTVSEDYYFFSLDVIVT